MEPALAAHDIHEPEQMFKVLRTQVDVVLPEGVAVLHAADARLVEMADLCDGEVIFYDVDQHQPGHGGAPRQGRAHRVGGRQPCAADPQRPCASALHRPGQRLGAPGDGRLDPSPAAGRRVQALLAAVAVAWALDISPELMAAGMETFDPTAQAVR